MTRSIRKEMSKHIETSHNRRGVHKWMSKWISNRVEKGKGFRSEVVTLPPS